jgi:adenosylcobinamide-phosphate synthase
MILMLALTLEWLIGDPQSRWHPVALFGQWATWCESFLYANAKKSGVITWLFVVAIPFALLWAVHSLLGWLFDALLLWACIGWKSLFEHVRSVLDADAVGQAREAVGLIVSRDSGQMSKEDARRAALESLAENASDAVVAPLFWFALLGPLGAAGYRMVNTLDAMWGYRNARYQAFGWCAAKVDDAANWLPARITARLMLWTGKTASWSKVKAQAESHASPNAGWPEVALAYAADVQLGGPVLRAGIEDERPLYGAAQARKTDAIAAFDALNVVRNTLLLAVALTFGVNFAF